MAGFDIHSPTTLVVLRRSREGTAIGEASFTVANQTGHAVRVRATAVAEGAADPGWFDYAEPGRERDFGKNASDTFVVLITVPPSAPAGDHSFRLDAVSVSLPDEEWGRGNSVRFQVPAIPRDEPHEDPPGYVETLGGALLGVLADIGAVLLLVAIAWLLSFVIGSGAFVLVILAVGIGSFGAWLGPVAGVFLMLRFRGFRDPWSTAIPMVVIMLVLGLPLVIAALAAANAVGGVGGGIVGVLIGAAAFSLPALGARAFARWRETGHL